MSEKIYGWLWRLFPSQFREVYGEEALQLFRDRLRDEKGFFLRLRLGMDLLGDFMVSVPREYRHIRSELSGVTAVHGVNGAPSFCVLPEKLPEPKALLFGALSALVALGAFWATLLHAGNPAAIGTLWLGRWMAGSEFSQPPIANQQPEGENHGKVKEGRKGAGSERRRVVAAAAANLREHYVDRVVGQKMADALVTHQRNGDDDAARDDQAFADLLTRQMRDVSQDMHLVVVYSRERLPNQPSEPTAEGLAREREALLRENCTFEKVKLLAHQIGYLKINSFPNPALCQATAVAAMAQLNQAHALIFDLRDNRGGEPKMVALLAAYLFDHPEYWYNPRENTTEQAWTRSPVPGNKLADQPVYVLTSARTSSGAEQFCYDLKMLKRATLVGETTGGAAHAGVWHRIDDHFGMGVPEVKPINPFAKNDWAGVGVEPHVKVKAAEALETAVKLAESKLEKK